MKWLQAFFQDLWKFMAPPLALSWQTLLWLSLFSCGMAALTSVGVRYVLSSLGWVFLILGVGWLTTEKPPTLGRLSLGPWITGALVSLWLFGEQYSRNPALVWVSWPLFSAAIASLPEFFHADNKRKLPDPAGRQRLIILVLGNLLLSCWLQFWFVAQRWLQQETSLSRPEVHRSILPFAWPFAQPQPQQGDALLDQAVLLVRSQLNNQPWPQVERWLLQLRQQPERFAAEVVRQLPPRQTPNQTALWRLEPQISTQSSGYQLQLRATWLGPKVQRNGYYRSRVCQIRQVPRAQTRLQPSRPSPQPRLEIAPGVGQVTCTVENSP